MADRPIINILSACTGGGGLDLALTELVFAGAARVICGIEREAHCVEVLGSRMEDQTLGAFPVWSDLRTFDGRGWRGLVDWFIAGYPCQPFSHAGKRGGAADPRHLWPHIARITEEAQPFGVFFENVPGHLTLGFADVRRELERLGYRVTAGLFTAEETGAPHIRQRLFIMGILESRLGHANSLNPQGGQSPGQQGEAGPAARRRELEDPDGLGRPGEHQPEGRGVPSPPSGAVAHPESGGCGVRGQSPGGDGCAQQGCGELAEPNGHPRQGGVVHTRRLEGGRGTPDTDRPSRAMAAPHQPQEHNQNPAGGNGERAPATAPSGAMGHAPGCDQGRREDAVGGVVGGAAPDWAGRIIPAYPPGPSDIDAWTAILTYFPDLAPAVEPRLRGVADGLASRLDRLRAGGNGVHPVEAAYAFLSLFACLWE